jgi:hypothetical protein
MKDSIRGDMQRRLQAYYAHAFPSRQGMRVGKVTNIRATPGTMHMPSRRASFTV